MPVPSTTSRPVVKRHMLAVTAGAQIQTAPRLRLPAGSIKVKLTDQNGTALAQQPISLFVTEGGGGFPSGPRPHPRSSQVWNTADHPPTPLQTDANGEFQLPDFVLGPHLGANRILVQSEFTHIVVTVNGTYAGSELASSGDITGVCDEDQGLMLWVLDATSGALVDVPVVVEVVEGGSWLKANGRLVRSAVYRSDFASRIPLSLRCSSRQDSSKIRAYLLDAPAVALAADVTLTVVAPGFYVNNTQGTIDIQWTHGGVGLGVYGMNGQPHPDSEVFTRQAVGTDGHTPLAKGKCVIEPEVISGSYALSIRHADADDFEQEFMLADYPDAPSSVVKGSGQNDPAAGTIDFMNQDTGITLKPAGGDVQYLGPSATAKPFEFDVVMGPTPAARNDPGEPGKFIQYVRLELTLSPAPDPSDPTDASMDVSGATFDNYYYRVPYKANSTQRVSIKYTSDASNTDRGISVAMSVIFLDGSSSSVPAAYLFGAQFFRARLTMSAGSGFTPIDGNALRPCPALDAKGNALTLVQNQAFYVELRCHDVGATAKAELVAGRRYDLDLSKVSTTDQCTLYRSQPLVCHLEAPEAYGQATLAASGGCLPVWVAPPYTLYAQIGATTFGSPQSHRTTTRPVAFLALDSTSIALRAAPLAAPSLPVPQLEFSGFGDQLAAQDGDIDAAYKVEASSDKKSAILKLKGFVRDAVLDLTKPAGSGPGAKRDTSLLQLLVAGTVCTLTDIDESVAPLKATPRRPYAWRGEFDTTVSLKPGLNLVAVVASNILGGQTRRILRVDLVDPRNDYDNPDKGPMRALVRVLADAEPQALPELMIATFRVPSPKGQALTTASAPKVTIEGGADKGAAPDQLTDVTLKRTTGPDQLYQSDPVIAVPADVDVGKARSAGVPVVRCKTGTSIAVSGTAMPHPAGAIDFHTALPLAGLEIKLLKLQADGKTYAAVTSIAVGDRFKVSARVPAALAITDLSLTLTACDRLGERLPGDYRRLRLYLQAPAQPNDGWLDMAGYLDPAFNPAKFLADKNPDILAIGRHGQASDGIACLRLLGGGSLRIEPPRQALTEPDSSYQWLTLQRDDGTLIDAYSFVHFLKKQSDGSFFDQGAPADGDEVTVEAAISGLKDKVPAIELTISTTSWIGLPASSERLKRIVLKPSASDPTVFRMSGAIGADLGFTASSTFTVRSGTTPAAAGQLVLRAEPDAGLVTGEQVGFAAQLLWPVAGEPRRQTRNDVAIPQESPRGTSLRAGARRSVVALTGELSLSERDVVLNGRGLSLAFSRGYSSFNDFDGPIGHGWSHSLDCWLRRLDDKTWLAMLESGRVETFTRDAGGALSSPAGIYALLEELGPEACRLTWEGGLVQIFATCGADTQGFLPLAASYDRCRNALGYTYDQTGLLAQAADPIGQRLYLRYEDPQRLATVADATSRAWRFKYHKGPASAGAAAPTEGANGDLLSVTTPVITTSHNAFAAGKTRSYGYEVAGRTEAKRHKLKSAQDGLGNANTGLPDILGIEYDDSGRVEYQTFDDDADRAAAQTLGKYKFVYADAPLATDITDRCGRVLRAEFTPGTVYPSAMNLIQMGATAAGGGAGKTYTSVLTYNDQSEVTRAETPLHRVVETGFKVTTDPRERGLMVSRTVKPAPGLSNKVLTYKVVGDTDRDPDETSPDSLGWSYSYESRFQQLETVTDPTGAVTTHLFDYKDSKSLRQDGNLTGVQLPTVTTGTLGAAPQTPTFTFAYNNFGQRISSIDPNGVVTSFLYYPVATPNGDAGSGKVAATAASPSEPTGHLARIINDDRGPAGTARSSSLQPPDPIAVEYGYDGRGYGAWVNEGLRTNDPQSTPAFTQLFHNEVGQMVEHYNAVGLDELFTYDENDNLVKHTEIVQDVLIPPLSGVNPAAAITLTHKFEHNRLGNPTSETIDADGLALKRRWTYDAEEALAFDYTPVANRAASPDAQRYTKIVRNDRGLPWQTIVAPDSDVPITTTDEYDDDGAIASTVDGENLKVTHVHDAWGNLVARVDGLGNAHRTLPDALGRAVRVQVCEGYVDESNPGKVLSDQIIYRNELGRETGRVELVFRHVDQPDGSTKLATIGTGRRVTSYEHDAGGNVTAVTTQDGLKSTTTYTGHGKVAAAIDPLAGTSSFTYDNLGNQDSVTFPIPPDLTGAGKTSMVLKRQYDQMGRLLRVENAGGFTDIRYDSLGRRRVIEDPVGNRVFTDYDGAGRPITVTREMHDLGQLTDPRTGQPTATLTPLVTHYAYDENNNLTLVYESDATKPMIEHAYNARDQRQSTTLADDGMPAPAAGGAATAGTRRKYALDYRANGMVKTVTLPDSQTITHVYDDAGRLKSRSSSTAAGGSGKSVTQTFTHDGAGRCVQAIDDNGDPTMPVTVDLRYDSLGNLWQDQQTIGSNARSSLCTYNDRGTLESVTYPEGWPVVTYARTDGRVSDIYETGPAPAGPPAPQPPAAQPQYHLAQLRFSGAYTYQRNNENGTSLTISHGSDGRLSEWLHHPTSDPTTPLSQETFEWSPTGLPNAIKDMRLKSEKRYFYDSAYRIIEIDSGKDPGDPNGRPTGVSQTGYDSRGNVLNQMRGAVTGDDPAKGTMTVARQSTLARDFNDADQLRRVTETDYSDPSNPQTIPWPALSYDARGNLVAPDAVQTYAYDAFNRLISVNDSGKKSTVSFCYDAFGRRLVKSSPNGTTRFAYAGDRLVEEKPPFPMHWNYLHTETELLALEVAGSVSTTRQYLHANRAGDVELLTDDSGAVMERYDYDQFGLPRVLNPDGTPKPFAISNPVLHHGQYFDAETGLYLAGSRYYSPKLQTFLQKDPLPSPAGGNLYSFAGNNSTAFTDPSGNFLIAIPIAIAMSFIATEIAAAVDDKYGEIWSGFSPIHQGMELYTGYKVSSVFGGYRGAQLGTADKVMNWLSVATAGLSVAGSAELRGSRYLLIASGVLSAGQLGYGAISSFEQGQYKWGVVNLLLLLLTLKGLRGQYKEPSLQEMLAELGDHDGPGMEIPNAWSEKQLAFAKGLQIGKGNQGRVFRFRLWSKDIIKVMRAGEAEQEVRLLYKMQKIIQAMKPGPVRDRLRIARVHWLGKVSTSESFIIKEFAEGDAKWLRRGNAFVNATARQEFIAAMAKIDPRQAAIYRADLSAKILSSLNAVMDPKTGIVTIFDPL